MPNRNLHTTMPIMVLILGLIPNIALSDHGRDYFMVQTARLGNTGDIFLIARQDYFDEEGAGSYIFEPLLSWTAHDRISLEVNADAEKVQGEKLNYEATVLGSRIRLTPEGQSLIVGMAIRYKMPSEPESEDTLKLAALGTYQVNSWLLGGNINYEKQRGSDHEWGFSMGAKRELRHHLSLGVEVSGSLIDNPSGETVVGLYYELIHGMQINAGIGSGFNNDIDLTAKTAFIWWF